MTELLRVFRGALAVFFDWWRGELAGLVPRALRRSAGGERSRLIVSLGRERTTVLEVSGASEQAVGSVDARAPDHDERLAMLLQTARRRRWPATVRLSAELGLRKILTLPAAAEADLEQLLQFEMDRFTPFTADDVYFAQRLVGTDPTNRLIEVELQVAPKRVVDRAMASMRRCGQRLTRVELAAVDPDRDVPLNLLPRVSGQELRESRLNRALALVAAVLAAIAVAIPLQQQRATIAELEIEVATARAQAEESMAMRQQLEQLTQSARFLLAEKTRRPMVTELLAELTRVIPDQAHIMQLQLRDGTVQLHGYAVTASDLIGLLDQSPLFRAPQFRSPVTQDPRTQTERFHLSVEVLAEEGG